MTSRRTLLASMITLAYGVPVVTLAAAARLSADYDRTSSYGVLTVSAPGASKIRTHVLGGRNPVRYLIDIEGVKLTEELSRDIRRIASDRFVSDVRCGQYKPDTVRIVAEMKKGVGGAVLTGSSLSRFRVRFAEGKSAQITQTESTPRQTAPKSSLTRLTARAECAPFLPVRPTSLSPYINARSARSPKKRIFL